MHLVSIIVAVAIVLTGIYFSQKNGAGVVEGPPASSEVLSEEESQEDDLSDEVGESSPTDMPNSPTNTSTPSPTENLPAPAGIESYRYPNSSVISSSESSLFLRSSDDTDKITDWYKEKIESEGMSAKSFVKTKTNDNVLNKLVGASSSKEVRVEIRKDSGETSTEISISVKYF